MVAPPSLFSPKQVAEALQVSESSVKRWCDQGLIPMIKTAGGHRRIPLDELMRFISDGDRPLLNPSALGLPEQRLGVPAQPKMPTTEGSIDQVAFRQALAEGNEVDCRDILFRAAEQLGSVTRAADLLVTDAMHRFGEAWEQSRLDVYQERHGCEICLRLIHELAAKLPATRGPVAIGGTPEKDPYALPTSLVQLALRETGWCAESLGTNLPLSSLRRAVEHYSPKLVWLSVSAVENAELFVDQFNSFADSLPEDCVLLVGGRALNDQLRPRLRYTAHCDSLRQLIGLAELLRLKTNLEVRQSNN